jgi:ubiquinol-cytochrome c reductase cytochrome b subunit
MNQLGFSGHPVPGSLLKPDPMEETVALDRARAELAAEAHATAHNGARNGSSNGNAESTGNRELVSGRPKDSVD